MTLETNKIISMIFIVGVLGQLQWVFGVYSSFSVQVLFIVCMGLYLFVTKGGLSNRSWGWTVSLFLIMSMHYIFRLLFSDGYDLQLFSVVSLLIAFFVVFSVVVISEHPGLIKLNIVARRVVVVVLFSVVCNILYRLFVDGVGVGIYSEPSHLAMGVSPFLSALVLSLDKKDNVFGWVGVLGVLFLANSTSFVLFFGVILAVSLSLYRKGISRRSLLVLLVFLCVVSGAIFFSSYGQAFFSRINGVINPHSAANLSSLVYLNGWLMAKENLISSGYLGLGINRMGCDPLPQTALSYVLNGTSNSRPLNYNDGSFIVSKMISEFGLFSVLILIWLFYRLFSSIKDIKNDRVRLGDFESKLFLGFAVVVVIGGFFRSTGYFSPFFLNGILSLLILKKSIKNDV